MKHKISMLMVVMFMPTLLWAQAVGGGGSGGGGLSNRLTKAPGCKEGTYSRFTVNDRGGDRAKTELRQCKNGSYYDLTDYIYVPKKGKCKPEGETSVWVDMDRNNNPISYLRVCTKGRWVYSYK